MEKESVGVGELEREVVERYQARMKEGGVGKW